MIILHSGTDSNNEAFGSVLVHADHHWRTSRWLFVLKGDKFGRCGKRNPQSTHNILHMDTLAPQMKSTKQLKIWGGQWDIRVCRELLIHPLHHGSSNVQDSLTDSHLLTEIHHTITDRFQCQFVGWLYWGGRQPAGPVARGPAIGSTPPYL